MFVLRDRFILCLPAHGCFHPNHQSVADQSALEPISDAQNRSKRHCATAVPEIHHSDQGVQYLSKAYITTLQEHGVEISVAQRGRPWENGYAERTHSHPQRGRS